MSIKFESTNPMFLSAAPSSALDLRKSFCVDLEKIEKLRKHIRFYPTQSGNCARYSSSQDYFIVPSTNELFSRHMRAFRCAEGLLDLHLKDTHLPSLPYFAHWCFEKVFPACEYAIKAFEVARNYVERPNSFVEITKGETLVTAFDAFFKTKKAQWLMRQDQTSEFLPLLDVANRIQESTKEIFKKLTILEMERLGDKIVEKMEFEKSKEAYELLIREDVGVSERLKEILSDETITQEERAFLEKQNPDDLLKIFLDRLVEKASHRPASYWSATEQPLEKKQAELKDLLKNAKELQINASGLLDEVSKERRSVVRLTMSDLFLIQQQLVDCIAELNQSVEKFNEGRNLVISLYEEFFVNVATVLSNYRTEIDEESANLEEIKKNSRKAYEMAKQIRKDLHKHFGLEMKPYTALLRLRQQSLFLDLQEKHRPHLKKKVDQFKEKMFDLDLKVNRFCSSGESSERKSSSELENFKETAKEVKQLKREIYWAFPSLP